RRHTRWPRDWSSDVCSSDLITAAVVGVIASLALWFGLRVLFSRFQPLDLAGRRYELPVPASLDWLALALTAAAAVLLLRMRLGRSEERRVGKGGSARRSAGD